MNHWNFSNICVALHGVQQQMLSVINKVHLLFKMKLYFLHNQTRTTPQIDAKIKLLNLTV